MAQETSSEGPLSIRTLVDAQDALVREAGLALPGQFTQCTYDLGPLKQAVYLCVTCGESRGVCGACSIACHGDHEQIELFPKRNFRCDCPTSSIPHPCTLKTPPQPRNQDNVYGQNFSGGGLFCRCASVYDARLERETMVQCVGCEDWFHESCLNLRERVESRSADAGPKEEAEMKSEPEGSSTAATAAGAPPKQESVSEPKQEPTPAPKQESLPTPKQEPGPATAATQDNEDDASSITSDPDLPPALIRGDTYDALICGQCVLKNPTVRRYAGTVGARMVLPDGEAGWRVIGGEEQVDEEAIKVDVGKEERPKEEMEIEEGGAGTKRRAQDDVDVPTKRARPGDPSMSKSKMECLAPRMNDEAQRVLEDLERLSIKSEEDVKPGPGRVRRALGDVFLSNGWREKWCRCSTCDPPLLLHPYLLHEEETYEPPADPDAALSLEELGMRALESLPHERALDSIRAYNSMRCVPSLPSSLFPYP
ncbi:hypothetical protein FRC12_021646 [Ceratobasidium sp. 428]|nr:hypothetical protein FRC12_021646 [Ceratobasidium sp. 428]